MGAEHDTMDPAYLRWMAGQLPRAATTTARRAVTSRVVDDQETYMNGLLEFLAGLDAQD